MVHHCGLCQKEVDDWDEHKRSKEHQDNLKNPEKIMAAFMESQASTFELIKKIEDENVGDPNNKE
jgi:hypothetical protein